MSFPSRFAKPTWLALSLALLPLGSAAATLRVAIVIDDGPDPVQAEAMLKVLAEAGAKVSFSYVGKAVDAHPELARLAVAAGHEINNHSYTHPNLTQVDDATAQKELSSTFEAVKKAVGQGPTWFWAPFLATNARVDAIALAAGSRSFPLSQYHLISSEDWNAQTDAETIYRRATTGVTDRTVLLFHEWRKETLQQLPAILTELKRQGAQFVTFSELVAGQP